MKLKKDPKWLPWVVLGLGCVAGALRFLLYRTGVDEKGLLVSWHPLELTLWGLLLVTLVLALAFTGKEPKRRRDEQLEALGQFMAAVGIAITAAGGFRKGAGMLDLIHMAAGIAAAVSLLYGAILRWQSKPEPIFCAAVSCVFFALHLVCRYRSWSAHPQVQDYFFPLMGAVCAMIFSYLRCESGKMKLRRVIGLLGAFCCVSAICKTQDPALYLGGALWMAANLHAPGEPV